MKVDRKLLLEQLESVRPGLAAKDITEQSTYFIFKDKKVMTYNDEIFCSQESCLPFVGAVIAVPLLSLVQKIKEDKLEINFKDKKVTVKGKKKQAGIRMETKISAPIESVESPSKWKKLPEDFAEAISIVQHCTSTDKTKFALTCIQLQSTCIEACDGYRAARYKIKMNLKSPVLIRKESLKHIISLEMAYFSKTKNWIHFRNASGLVLSCRLWIEDFPDISKMLKVKGTPIVFPKGLKDAVDKATIFSAENASDSQTIVSLSTNKIMIKGTGDFGYYKEVKKAKYKGKNFSFGISPELLTDLLKRSKSCQVTSERLLMKTNKYSFITVLDIVKGSK